MNLAPESSTPNRAAAALAAPKRASAKAGYAMAALLVAIAVMGVMLSVALPTWSHMIRREKEEELIFRGNQYARAINLYGEKNHVACRSQHRHAHRAASPAQEVQRSAFAEQRWRVSAAVCARSGRAGTCIGSRARVVTAWIAESASPRCGSPRCRDELFSRFRAPAARSSAWRARTQANPFVFTKGSSATTSGSSPGVELSSTPGGGGQGGPPGMPGAQGHAAVLRGDLVAEAHELDLKAHAWEARQDPGTTFTPIQPSGQGR